jgi:16S rRNA G966 N2-methylase RsmD
VFTYIRETGRTFDLVFAGPPYALAEIDELPKLVFQHGLLNPGGWFILEHTPRNDYKNFPNFRTERKYGTTLFSIFKNPAVDD